MTYKKILVAGCAGFIGSQTVIKLLENNFEVIGVDNLNDYYDPLLKKYRLENLKKYNNFTFFKTDIENIGALDIIFRTHKPDAVINLAARAGVRASRLNPHVYLTTNSHGTLNFLELMVKHNVKKLVLASTSSLYAGQQMPFTEDLAVNTPISAYAATKKAAELMAYTYHYLYELDISVVRYFTVFGPAGRPDMSIFRFIKWIDEGADLILTGDGEQSRDFTYVTDIAAGTVAALKDVGYEIINLGGGRNPRTMNDVISIIENLLHKKAVIKHVPIPKEDLKSTWADISKADKLLSWIPEISLEKGLELTVKWYKDNIELNKKIKLT